jgi:hypothetical protein
MSIQENITCFWPYVESSPRVMMQIIVIIMGGKYRRVTDWWHQPKGGEMERVLRGEENQCMLHIHMKTV